LFFRYDQERGDRFEFTRYPDGGPHVPHPRWHYDPEAGITLTVLVEADTAEAANARAERFGWMADMSQWVVVDPPAIEAGPSGAIEAGPIE